MLYGHTRLRAQPRAVESERSRITKPTPKEIKAMAAVAGIAVSAEVAARIANSVGPAFEGFAPIAGTLPFDLEPATFLVVQASTEKAVK